MMRILVVMIGSGAGGLQQTAVPYAEALRRNGHEVLLALWTKSPLLIDAQAYGLPLALVPWRPKPFPFGLLQTRALRRIISDFAPDGIVAIAQKGLKQAVAATKGGIPVLSRCGGTRPQVIKKLLSADHLIVTSEEMGEIAVQCGADPARMSVVPNFLLGSAVAHDYTRAEPLVVGSLGRLTHRKGYDLLIAAAARAQQAGARFKLVIGGSGEEAARLAAQAKQLGVPLDLPGWIGNDEKSAFLQGLDIFVCPSRFEPFGNVYLEAMQHGVPVLTADTTGARAIFNGSDDVVIIPGEDVAALSLALCDMLKDQQRRMNIGRMGQARFVAEFAVETAGLRLSNAVTRVVTAWHQTKGRGGR